jgi:hypothetical protein
MSDVTPILEILMDCQSDAERADWLLRAPKGILFRDYCNIRRILAAAQFARGVDALDVEFAAINATRMAGGELPAAIAAGVETARSYLRGQAERGLRGKAETGGVW